MNINDFNRSIDFIMSITPENDIIKMCITRYIDDRLKKENEAKKLTSNKCKKQQVKMTKPIDLRSIT